MHKKLTPLFEDSLMAGKASFNWIDPLLLDQQLTEEERMVRDSA
jgi:glutaryl-CoA dehydrogenase